MMQNKAKVFFGLLIAFEIFLEASCKETNRQCYYCDSVETCKDSENMGVVNCTVTDNPDESEYYCIEYQDVNVTTPRYSTRDVIWRGCSPEAIIINGWHQIGCNEISLLHENEYIVKRFCICREDRCNFQATSPTVRTVEKSNDTSCSQKQEQKGEVGAWEIIKMMGFIIGCLCLLGCLCGCCCQ